MIPVIFHSDWDWEWLPEMLSGMIMDHSKWFNCDIVVKSMMAGEIQVRHRIELGDRLNSGDSDRAHLDRVFSGSLNLVFIQLRRRKPGIYDNVLRLD